MLVKKLDERFHRCFDLEMALNPVAACAAIADAQFGIPAQYFQRVGAGNPYCSYVIEPKVAKFRKHYMDRLKRASKEAQ